MTRNLRLYSRRHPGKADAEFLHHRTRGDRFSQSLQAIAPETITAVPVAALVAANVGFVGWGVVADGPTWQAIFVARLCLVRQPEAGQRHAGKADAEFLQRRAARDGLGEVLGEFIEFVVHGFSFIWFVGFVLCLSPVTRRLPSTSAKSKIADLKSKIFLRPHSAAKNGRDPMLVHRGEGRRKTFARPDQPRDVMAKEKL